MPERRDAPPAIIFPHYREPATEEEALSGYRSQVCNVIMDRFSYLSRSGEFILKESVKEGFFTKKPRKIQRQANSLDEKTSILIASFIPRTHPIPAEIICQIKAVQTDADTKTSLHLTVLRSGQFELELGYQDKMNWFNSVAFTDVHSFHTALWEKPLFERVFDVFGLREPKNE